MELYQLKSFLAIARESNLTRAAQALNLSQSALSSQLKLLEEELGVVLFQRTSRGMVLTEGGRTLQAHAQEVLQAAKRMRQKAITLHRGRGESLVIGLHADPGFLRVSDLQRRLALLHAHLEVAFSPCSTAGAVPALRQGSVDLGFCFGESFEADVEHLSLARVRSCVVIPPALIPVGKSLGWQEIASLPWVWGGDESPFYAALLDHMEQHRVSPRPAVSAADENTVRELALAGEGLAVLREDVARPLAEAGRLVVWERCWLLVPLSLVWLARKGKQGRVRDAVEAVRHVWRQAARSESDGSLADKCWV